MQYAAADFMAIKEPDSAAAATEYSVIISTKDKTGFIAGLVKMNPEMGVVQMNI